MFGWFKKDNTPRWEYPELPTPKKEEDYQKIATLSLEDRMTWIQQDDWTLISDEDGVLLEEKEISGSSTTCIRARMILHHIDFEKMFQEQYNPTFEQRVKVYDELLAHKNVKEIKENLVVGHSHYKAPFSVTNRDFLALRTYQICVDDSHLIAIQSINDEEIPFEDRFVRGVSNCGIFLVPNYNDKDSVLCITVDHVDPKGSVPSFVINMYKKKAKERLLKMQEVYRKN